MMMTEGKIPVAVVENAFGRHRLRRFDYEKASDLGKEEVEELNHGVRAALDHSGFVVIENAVSKQSCERVISEMQEFIDATPHGLHGLGGTRRVGALVARSPASHEMISHPAILSLVKYVIAEQRLTGDVVRIAGREGKGKKGFRYPWHLHLTQIIDVGPGGGSEKMPHQLGLHRANGMWIHDLQDMGLNPQIEVMWALTDFTTENGATHVVLGSHQDRSQHSDTAYSEPTVQAEMSQGSLLVWTGWSVHGAGENRSDTHRIGMNINYSAGFLVQEENQFLACPPHIARNLPEQMQQIIGYRQPSGSLNYVAECQSPADSVLQADFDVLVPGSHGYPMDSLSGGQVPLTSKALESRLKDLNDRKDAAIELDDLELALQLKKAINVLKRSQPKTRD